MLNTNFKIHERTALIYGGSGPLVYSISSHLTELGADVALVGEKANQIRAFSNSINDRREIHADYGRMEAIETQFTNEKQVGEAISRTAEIFGSLDILIDLSPIESTERERQIERSRHLAQEVFAFLSKRSRSRMIYVFNSNFIDGEDPPTETMDLYRDFMRTSTGEGTTFNGLSLGMTEDSLRSHFPQCANVEEARQKVLEKNPGIKLVNFDEISFLITFLCSPLSSAINGQIIYADKGFSINT